MRVHLCRKENMKTALACQEKVETTEKGQPLQLPLFSLGGNDPACSAGRPPA